MCSSMWQATFSLSLLRHRSATLDAIRSACSLFGAAKIARRSAPSSLRFEAPTTPRRSLEWWTWHLW